MLDHFLDTNTDPMTVAIRAHGSAPVRVVTITKGPARDELCTPTGSADELRGLARELLTKADAMRATARFYRMAADHLDAGK